MVSRRSIWLRIVTQDITLIQAQMVPVLAKAPCDVLAVAGSWDDLARTGHICLRDVETVSRLWHVIRVQDQVRVGCQPPSNGWGMRFRVTVAPELVQKRARRDDRHLPSNRTFGTVPMAHVRFGLSRPRAAQLPRTPYLESSSQVTSRMGGKTVEVSCVGQPNSATEF